VDRLAKEGFKVWRYKIESTLLDSRYDDSKRPLNKAELPEKEANPKPPADGALSGRVCEHNWVMDGHNAGDPICSKCFARE